MLYFNKPSMAHFTFQGIKTHVYTVTILGRIPVVIIVYQDFEKPFIYDIANYVNISFYKKRIAIYAH